jgi:hypothetical protein
MALAVDSCPAAMKVMTFARISCRVSLRPVPGSRARMSSIRTSFSVLVSCLSRSRSRAAIISSTAWWNARRPAEKNGALQHIERKIGCLFCNVEHAAVPVGPASDQPIDRGHHCRRPVFDQAGSEKRSDQPALRIPMRIFRRQQTPTESSQHPFLKAILAIVGLVLLEDPTHRGRIIHNDNLTEWKASPDNRFFKMSLCPCLYWITT